MCTPISGTEYRPADRDSSVANGARGANFKLWLVSALFLVEVLALTMRFDSQTITGLGRRAVTNASGQASLDPLDAAPNATREFIAWLFQKSGVALGLGVAVAAATVFFQGERRREELVWRAGPSRRRWSRPMLLGHFASLAIFTELTGSVFEGEALSSTLALIWIMAWVVSGLAVPVLLVATVLPTAYRAPLARQGLRALAVGLIVGIAATGTAHLTQQLWQPLGLYTLECVHVLLGLASTDLVYEPARSIVGTTSFAVEIAPQCSGYEGIGLVVTFLLAYLWFCRGQLRFPRAWLLLPLGAAAIWLANVLRITALVAVGTCLSAEVAVGGFHSKAGWLGFNAVALGLVILARRSTFFRRQEAMTAAPVDGPTREAVYLAPMLAIVATAMITGAFSAGGLDLYYPARLAAVAVPLWMYRREYRKMRWRCSWQAPGLGLLVFAIWVARWNAGPSGFASGGGLTAVPEFGWWTFWLLARIVGSVVTVPLAEELAFRGFLTRRLIAADFDTVAPGRFTRTSFVLSSLAFGVLHDRWLEGTAAGMLYAAAYYRRGSLGDALAAHATTNALLSADALVTGDWSLFS